MYGINMEPITQLQLKKLSNLSNIDLFQYQAEPLWKNVTYNTVRAVLMYYKYIHEPKPLYIKDRIQKKSYKNTIYYLIGRVELLSEHENLTKVKNMYKPIIDEYYSIQDDTLEMPDELYQIIIKSIDLLLEDIDRDTQRRVDRLTSLLEKIEGDEK
jgi:hypothetical protein